jgi:hypothetical protein
MILKMMLIFSAEINKKLKFVLLSEASRQNSSELD